MVLSVEILLKLPPEQTWNLKIWKDLLWLIEWLIDLIIYILYVCVRARFSCLNTVSYSQVRCYKVSSLRLWLWLLLVFPQLRVTLPTPWDVSDVQGHLKWHQAPVRRQQNPTLWVIKAHGDHVFKVFLCSHWDQNFTLKINNIQSQDSWIVN